MSWASLIPALENRLRRSGSRLFTYPGGKSPGQEWENKVGRKGAWIIIGSIPERDLRQVWEEWGLGVGLIGKLWKGRWELSGVQGTLQLLTSNPFWGSHPTWLTCLWEVKRPQ